LDSEYRVIESLLEFRWFVLIMLDCLLLTTILIMNLNIIITNIPIILQTINTIIIIILRSILPFEKCNLMVFLFLLPNSNLIYHPLKLLLVLHHFANILILFPILLLIITIQLYNIVFPFRC